MAGPTEAPLCVHCRRKPIDPAWRPFCGERCRLLDLARWADGSYRVPGETLLEPDGEESKKGEGKS
jgi:endogenous inhibitor of DNA gyrase (YacG/DUF329 family)